MNGKIRIMTSVVGLYTLKEMYPFWTFSFAVHYDCIEIPYLCIIL